MATRWLASTAESKALNHRKVEDVLHAGVRATRVVDNGIGVMRFIGLPVRTTNAFGLDNQPCVSDDTVISGIPIRRHPTFLLLRVAEVDASLSNQFCVIASIKLILVSRQ